MKAKTEKSVSTNNRPALGDVLLPFRSLRVERFADQEGMYRYGVYFTVDVKMTRPLETSLQEIACFSTKSRAQLRSLMTYFLNSQDNPLEDMPACLVVHLNKWQNWLDSWGGVNHAPVTAYTVFGLYE